MVRVLVPLAPGCEELEAVTIIDVLRRAGFDVVSAGLQDQTVVASRKTILVADSLIEKEQSQSYDLVVLPGGLPGADHLAADARIIQILRSTVHRGGTVAAICAAPKVLAQAGLLGNVRATAYPGVLEKMRDQVAEISKADVEIDGQIVTSRGPATAIDFALALIRLLAGDQQAKQTEQALQGV